MHLELIASTRIHDLKDTTGHVILFFYCYRYKGNNIEIEFSNMILQMQQK